MNSPASKLLSTRSTKNLIQDLIATKYVHNKHIYTVRGWILDELTSRNPEGYDRWLESDAIDEELEKYLLG